MLTQQHIELVKATIPLLESAGTAITEHFYQRMFSHNPELKHVFNLSHQHSGRQPVALFNAVAAYAKNIENLDTLASAVERIAHKHTSFNIQAEQYSIVGHHLIETLRELAPDAFTAEIEEAWTAAYGFLADIFIKREAEIYSNAEQSQGGWEGKREFIIQKKTQESELVCSFELSPKDGLPVMSYQPGQYLGIELQPSKSEYTEIRQYSLSDKPNGKTYRISVKREAGTVPGIVSNYLHDEMQEGDSVYLYAPAGDFFLKPVTRPVVLISAGVGLTPMMAMLETLTINDKVQDITFLHACANQEQHSFKSRLNALTVENKVSSKVWYESESGFMNLKEVDGLAVQADFYLCGPLPFMQMVYQQLLSLGVAEADIHYELFGPHQSLAA